MQWMSYDAKFLRSLWYMPRGCGTEWHTLDSRRTLNKQTDSWPQPVMCRDVNVSRGGTPDTRMWARDGRLPSLEADRWMDKWTNRRTADRRQLYVQMWMWAEAEHLILGCGHGMADSVSRGRARLSCPSSLRCSWSSRASNQPSRKIKICTTHLA